MKPDRRILAAVVAVVVLVGGAVVINSKRPDTTPLLPLTGVTLSGPRFKTGAPGSQAEVGIASSLVRASFAEERGEVLRFDGVGPWHTERVSGDTAWVTGATECATALVAVGASGASSVAMETVDPAPRSSATVWRNVTGTEWTSAVVAGLPANSTLTGVVSGRALGAPKRLVASGRTLTTTSDAFAVVSDDCGATWVYSPLTKGQGPGFEYAAAVTATPHRFVMVGRADGSGDGFARPIVWTSAEGRTWTVNTGPASDGVYAYSPSEVAIAGKMTVVQSADNRRRLGGTLHRWDGESGSWFSRRGLIEDDAVALGVVETAAGVFTAAVAFDRTKLELSRVDVGALRPDRVPRVTFKRYSTPMLLSDGGRRMWIVGERRDTGRLDTWTLTLPDTTSAP